MYEPQQMVPAVAQIKSGYTRQVSPARKFVFTPRGDPHKSHLYCGERERNPELAGAGRYATSTAGYLYWRGGFPPQTPPSAHAKNRGRVLKQNRKNTH